MLRSALMFGAGALIFHQLAELPAWPWLAATLAVALACSTRRRLCPLGMLAAGLAWSHAYALLTVPPHLPGDGEVMRLIVSGPVVSVVERRGAMTRFTLAADRVEGPAGILEGEWRLRLSWRDAPEVVSGERWRLPVRLRAVHGFASPGAWDYEGWWYWQGVRYRGYVSADAPAQRLAGPACCRLARWRQVLGEAVAGLPVSAFAVGVTRAITLGDRQSLDAQSRALFRDTGTSHLMAISGLHIGLLAGLGMGMVGWCWRRVPPLCARFPARRAGAAAGFVLAVGYALLSGMGLPAQRAVIMLACLLLALLGRRDVRPQQALALALIAVLVWHPPSVIAAGFWLSFGAVALILAALQAARRAPAWRQGIRVHLVLSIGLWPLLAVFGLPASAAAPLANLVLVPLFGFVVVPLALVGVGLLAGAPAWGAGLLSGLAAVLDGVYTGLDALASLPWPDLAAAPLQGVLLLAAITGIAWLLVPLGTPLRWLALPLLALCAMPREPRLAHGDFELQVLDVGQGLSTVVVTRSHTLVFDTGPQFGSGFATARAVLLPMLRAQGIERIDRLLVSHGDIDHAGGIAVVRDAVEVGRIESGEPQRVGHDARPCAAGQAWRWDGVEFRLLHPPPGHREDGNNASCVLRVGNAAGSVLLTGDIEGRVERRLVALYGEALRSDLAVAPHHGSASSSTRSFIDAVDADWVIYTAGWANRYGFPNARVAARWRAAGVRAVNTADAGTLTWRFAADGQLLGPRAHRLDGRRFWMHRGGSAAATHAVSSGDPD